MRKMSYVALDLKYRPLTFSGVVGNDSIVKVLLKRSAERTLTKRCLMFSGPKGSGKTTLARISARSGACVSLVEGEPCNQCEACVSHLNGTSVDTIEIDAASGGTVDRIRTIISNLEYTSITGSPPILILDEAHRLGPASQDALLKSMEDRSLLVIFCTTEPNKIRPALRDRVDEFPVRNPSGEVLFAHLKRICDSESISVQDADLLSIINNSSCSPRVCLNTISRLSDAGVIASDAVQVLYRVDSHRLLDELLVQVSFSGGRIYQTFDSLMASESAVWVQSELIRRISGALRKKYSSNASDLNNSFLNQSNETVWMRVADRLIAMSNPSIADLEFIVLNAFSIFGKSYDTINSVGPTLPSIAPNLSSIQQAPTVASSAPVPPTVTWQTPTGVSSPKPKPTGGTKPLEVDGVKFSDDERISVLHDRITPSRGPTGASSPSDSLPVQFKGDKVPMTAQEFSRAFIERIKT